MKLLHNKMGNICLKELFTSRSLSPLTLRTDPMQNMGFKEIVNEESHFYCGIDTVKLDTDVCQTKPSPTKSDKNLKLFKFSKIAKILKNLRVLGEKLHFDKSLEIAERDYENGTYFGQILNSRRNGLGIFITNKAVYKGTWENDLPNGLGKLKFKSGGKYSGNFANGMYDGYGVYTKLGSEYMGNWKKNLRHGRGKEKAYEYKYKGRFKRGFKHGRGKFKLKTGKVKGVFKKGKLDKGTLTISNGVKYISKWRNSTPIKNCSVILDHEKKLIIKNMENPLENVVFEYRNSKVTGKILKFSDGLEFINKSENI